MKYILFYSIPIEIPKIRETAILLQFMQFTPTLVLSAIFTLVSLFVFISLSVPRARRFQQSSLLSPAGPCQNVIMDKNWYFGTVRNECVASHFQKSNCVHFHNGLNVCFSFGEAAVDDRTPNKQGKR